MFPSSQPCTHALRSPSSFSTTRWYSLFLLMWLWWRFQEGLVALWVWPPCDRQQTTAAVGEGDLAEKKTSGGWMGRSWTRFLLLTTSVKQTYRGPKKHIHWYLFISCSQWYSCPNLASWAEIKILEEDFFYFFSCCFPVFIPLALIFVTFPSVHLSISLSCRFKGSLCASSSQ